MPAIPIPRRAFALDVIKKRISRLQNSKRDFEPPEDSRPGPHPALIFGCVAIVMAIVFATCIFCARRRMKKRQAQYQKIHNRISAVSARKNNNNNNNDNRNGVGRGSFPGYQYHTADVGYNYTSGYHQGNAADPDGPPPAYSSQPSTADGSANAASRGA